MKKIILCLTILCITGCSAFTVKGPAERDMACTTDNLAPALDFLYATGTVVGSVAPLITSEEPVGSADYATLAMGLAIGAAFAYSGRVGMHRTQSCREHINAEFRTIREIQDRSAPASTQDFEEFP